MREETGGIAHVSVEALRDVGGVGVGKRREGDGAVGKHSSASLGGDQRASSGHLHRAIGSLSALFESQLASEMRGKRESSQHRRQS